jgi:hypothetical protein
MRTMMIAAAAALGMASSAAAAEPPACYDAAVIGWTTDYTNERLLDRVPMPLDRILPRVQADTLVQTWSQVAGPTLPKVFWARAVLTEEPRPSPPLLIYLKTRPDGVPAIVGYTYDPFRRRPLRLDAYPAC